MSRSNQRAVWAGRVRCVRIAALILGFWLLSLHSESACIAAERRIDARLEADRTEIDQKFEAELEALAKKCDELGLKDQARTTRSWFVPRRYQVQFHFLPDFFARDIREKRMPGAPAATAPEVERQWWNKFQVVRAAQSKRLFELAKKRASQNRLQESFALLHEVLREDPDQLEARRIAGYTGKPGAWSPQERQPKYSKSTKTETTFNWAPNRHGVVDTSHFRIRTNASAAEALEAANFLEECHDVWKIVFANFWLEETGLQLRWEGKPSTHEWKIKDRLEVILFASRDEYVSQLEPIERNIAASRGYYAPGRKTSFFYVDGADDEVRANWAHEISHQLFSAYAKHPTGLAKNSNFWLIEGAAMYMESIERRDGYWTTGGFEANRLQDARHRLLNMKEHVTVRDLMPLGQDAFQRDERVRQFYTAGAGYTHFFLDGRQALWRGTYQRNLRDLYANPAADKLSQGYKFDYVDVNDDYAKFLQVQDDDLLTLDRFELKRLVLGRTGVSGTGLETLKKCSKLKWLDLTDLKLELDDGLSYLSPECDLSELSLFGVKLTSACGERLAKMKSLRELTLARTDVDDAVCAPLSTLPVLEVLDLSGTKVTDGAEEAICKMKSLKELDVSETKITPSCVERIKKALPELKITP